ncbi:MAG: hypothetical protein K2W95_15255 [Candidatus Obscuribacterales bacterium]|nr:hypothetical protein [Candidatus Obscuribacterales bacterium]
MSKFYFQQIAGTIAIAGVWCAAVVLLTSDFSPSRVRKESNTIAVVRERVEARDEATGEESRVHRFSEDGQRTQMEVKFKDKTTGLVHFNVMGRPGKIEEQYPDGSMQVFYLRPNGSLAKRQSFRKDKTLKSETLPAAENAALTTVYGDDGKTVVRTEQQWQDGAVETVTFRQDGRTPELRYKTLDKDGNKATLTTYDDSGKVVTVENIERDGNNGSCGDPMCHECGGEMSITMTRYRADGSIWVKGQWNYSYGNVSINSLEEFAKDGKTLVKRITSINETLPDESTKNDNTAYTKVEKFESGKLQSVRLLRSDNTVAREETAGSDGKLGAPTFNKKDTQVKEEVNYADPASLSLRELLEKVTPQPEPNHLQQMFSR